MTTNKFAGSSRRLVIMGPIYTLYQEPSPTSTVFCIHVSLTTAVLLLAFAPDARYISFLLLLFLPPRFSQFGLVEPRHWVDYCHGGPTPHAHRHRGHGVSLAGGRINPWRVLPHVVP